MGQLLQRLFGVLSIATPTATLRIAKTGGRRMSIARNGGRHASVRGARFLVVGDVHGCRDELELLLAKAAYDETTTQLVLVGDLVNKGPSSAGVVRWCRERGALCVRGNHDDRAVDHWRKHFHLGLAVPGKYAYVKELSAADGAWLEALPHTLSLPDVDAIVVHAGLAPGVPLDEQAQKHMTRMRSLSDGAPSDAPGAASWAATRRERPLVVFGHDAKRGLQVHANAVGLDTGCCYGKKLTALRLAAGEPHAFVAVDALREYAKPGG